MTGRVSGSGRKEGGFTFRVWLFVKKSIACMHGLAMVGSRR